MIPSRSLWCLRSHLKPQVQMRRVREGSPLCEKVRAASRQDTNGSDTSSAPAATTRILRPGILYRAVSGGWGICTRRVSIARVLLFSVRSHIHHTSPPLVSHPPHPKYVQSYLHPCSQQVSWRQCCYALAPHPRERQQRVHTCTPTECVVAPRAPRHPCALPFRHRASADGTLPFAFNSISNSTPQCFSGYTPRLNDTPSAHVLVRCSSRVLVITHREPIPVATCSGCRPSPPHASPRRPLAIFPLPLARSDDTSRRAPSEEGGRTASQAAHRAEARGREGACTVLCRRRCRRAAPPDCVRRGLGMEPCGKGCGDEDRVWWGKLADRAGGCGDSVSRAR